MNQSDNDCYFFYYSQCSKGDMCPFRHEPAALNQEVVCSFWKQGKCTKPNCAFRHMEVQKDRRNIKCFWESQPTGCTKPHCPFLHENVKDPYIPEAVSPTTVGLPLAATGKIIVNKNKLDELVFPSQSTTKSRTVILANPQKKSIKDRLGMKMEDNEGNSEEENLRRGALGTIDLRKRLTSKRKHSEEEEEFSPEDDEDFKMRSVVKKVKKERKEKKKKEKKEKKSKRSERRHKSGDDSQASTLAQRIAAQREGTYATNRSEDEQEPEHSTTVRKMKIKSRIAKNEDKESVLSVIDDVDALLKSSEPLPISSGNAVGSYKGDSSDVMKELDELINS